MKPIWNTGTTVYGTGTHTRIETQIHLVDKAASDLGMPYTFEHIMQERHRERGHMEFMAALFATAVSLVVVGAIVTIAWFALGGRLP